MRPPSSSMRFGTEVGKHFTAESSDFLVQGAGEKSGTDLVKVEALRNVGALLISPPGETLLEPGS